MGSILPTVAVGAQTYTASALLECSDVEGPFAEGVIKTCNKLQFTVGQGTLAAGKYDVVVTNPAPADCHSVEKLELTVVPPPTLAAIAPDLVCVAQGDQAMVLTGDGFLQVGVTLPIVIVGTKTYNPTSAEDCEPLPGTFAEGLVSSCTTLNFTIPAADLPAGDYAVVITNPPPANCSSSDLVNLHVAPPPTITGLVQGGICDAQADQTVSVIGTDFLKIGGALPSVTIGSLTCKATGTPCQVTDATGCVAVPGTFSEGAVEECTGLTVVIPMGALAAGSYPVSVKNPDPAGCSTANSTVELEVVPPPTVAGVSPASICTNGGTLNITGTDFGTNPTVTLTLAGSPDVAATEVTVNGDGSLTAKIPMGAEPDTNYTVIVNNGCDDVAPHKTVHVVPGPKLFFADPEVVYNGISTRVTLYVTSLTLPLTSVSITPAGGGTPLTLAYTVDASGRKVQVIVPAGTAPGSYDLKLADSVDCPAELAGAITITDSRYLSLKSVVPPFGWNSSNTDITIYRDTAAPAPADQPFVAVPRVFMNPSNATGTEPAIQLTATSMTDANTLTSVVPKGSLPNTYDLIVVNPDGAVGVLENAFEVTDLPPPVITSATPASVVNTTGQNVVVSGTDFRASTLSVLSCADELGAALASVPSITSGTVTCSGSACTQAGVLNASSLPAGASCVLQLTNDDGTWAIYSAIGVSGSSLNLPNPRVGTPMTTARRALVSVAGDATQAARFVYAIGGDSGGATPTTYDTVESAPVDVFGNMGTWFAQRYTLGGPRAFAAAAQLGRYTYLCGGTDGSAALSTCKRAMILDPLEKPSLDVADLLIKDAGLDPGYWYYRVAATFSSTDIDNPGGESLPSDEIVVKVPALAEGKKVQIVLAWSAPVDSTGALLPNVSGYRIYRTAAVNGAAHSEVLLATVGAAATQYTDDGSATPGTDTFLPLGSTGTWADLPSLSIAREGLAMTWAADPAQAGRFHVYAFLGRQSATTTSASYEHLSVDVLPNGHQTVGASWTAGLSNFSAGRWQMSAFRGDSTLSSFITAPNTYLWVGGGLNAGGTAADQVEAGKVAAGGDLGAIQSVKSFTASAAGYGACAANGQLFVFGGAGSAGGAPSTNAKSAKLASPAPTLTNNSWNSEGMQMTQARYLMGSAVQSAYIFLVGGTTASAPASETTEVVIW